MNRDANREAMSDAGAGADADSEAGQDTRTGDAGQPGTSAPPAHTFVYVGGYSNTDPLRVFEIDRATLALSEVAQDAGAGPQPTYITPSPDGRTLYLANEAGSYPGITVLRVDPHTGVPTRVDHEEASASPYVFSALSPDGKYLLAASYDGGNVGVYPVRPDGTLDPHVDTLSFGMGAQSHCVRVHPSGAVFVPNKGLDSVAQLKLDATGRLTAGETFPAQTARALYDGPRHIAFSRDHRHAFLILELGDALISLAVQGDGTLREVDREPRRPANARTPEDTGAHVLAHPHANFVYGSNRGTDTLVAFAYDQEGALTPLGHVASRGRKPRHFDIDPRGEFLIVANQESDKGGTLAVFAIGDDGRLSARGDVVSGLSSPAAVAIVAH